MGQEQSSKSKATLTGLKINFKGRVFEIEEISKKVTLSSFISSLNKRLTIETMPIISIQSSYNFECLDYWLSLPERTLQPLQNDEQLKAVLYKKVPSKIGISTFEIIKVIGKGAYSIVTQVRKKDTGLIYAMKSMKKSLILEQELKFHIFGEREILSTIQSPFISKLHWAFQSSNTLHFIMDFYPGGELFYHLRSMKNFTEAQTKFYFAEILLGLEALHSKAVAYRDLKPENIVIDMDGHIRLTDFGLSRVNMLESSMSFCGSPEYMSPEMIKGHGHSRNVDFYCLGALVYEMLTGRPPFYDRDKMRMYKKILHNQLELPEKLSEEAKSILNGLLTKDPGERLGAKGFEQIFNHAWCKDIDWERVKCKDVQPPFVPELRNSNFDRKYTEMKLPKNYFSDSEPDNDGFEEFDYNLEQKRGEISRFCFERSKSKRSSSQNQRISLNKVALGATMNSDKLQDISENSESSRYLNGTIAFSPVMSEKNSCVVLNQEKTWEFQGNSLLRLSGSPVPTSPRQEVIDKIRKSIEVYTSPRVKEKIVRYMRRIF